ncbi:MAG: radical SAM protein [Clostridiales bacterium]|nr:radical SAM protein [Clostridiales bacterium]
MLEMEDASTPERALIEIAKARRAPINGSLELLPLCNMRCDMCYVRLSRAEMERLGRLRTAEEWLSLAEQMRRAGVLFLLLTGGEPLLYPGFKTLFAALRSMGFVLTINTNATLIDEGWADFLAQHRPRRVNVTLYGADEADYARLCHFPGGFARALRGIRLLRARGIDVKLSFSVTRANLPHMERVFALGGELDVPVHIDPYMMPAVRERSLPFDSQSRVSPEEAARAALRALRLQLPEDFFRQYVRQSLERVRDPAFPRGDGHVSCLAGNCSFTVNWQGEMRPCVVLSSPSVPVFDTGFDAAWQTICEQTRAIRIHPQCTQCSLRPLCKICAAAALLETGAFDGIPPYLCRYAEETLRLLLEEEKLHG